MWRIKKKKYSFVQSNGTAESILIRIYYEIYNNSQNNAVTSIHMSIIKYILENREHIECYKKNILSKFEEVIICSLCQEMTSNYIIHSDF